MPRRFRHAVAIFTRRAEGMVAIEFALVSVPFLGLLFAIVETTMIFLFQMTLANTSQHVARIISTGQLQQSGVVSADGLKTRFLCPATGARMLPAFVGCDRLFIDVRTADAFTSSDVSKTFYSAGASRTFCPGGPGAIVVVRVAFAMPVFLPSIAFVEGMVFGVSTAGLVSDVPGFPGWNHLIAHAEVFQNEPFAVTAAMSSCG